MAFIKKEWKDRLVEFAGRRKLTRVAGSIDNQIVVDVTREEGAVSQQGDAFSEANMNDLEQRIEDGFNDTIDKNNILDKEEVEANTEAGKYVADALVVKEISYSLGGLNFYEDEDGNKYVVGADAVPKKLGSNDITITAYYKDTNILTTYNYTFSEAGKFLVCITVGGNATLSNVVINSVHYEELLYLMNTSVGDRNTGLRVFLVDACIEDTITISSDTARASTFAFALFKI